MPFDEAQLEITVIYYPQKMINILHLCIRVTKRPKGLSITILLKTAQFCKMEEMETTGSNQPTTGHQATLETETRGSNQQTTGHQPVLETEIGEPTETVTIKENPHNPIQKQVALAQEDQWRLASRRHAFVKKKSTFTEFALQLVLKDVHNKRARTLAHKGKNRNKSDQCPRSDGNKDMQKNIWAKE